MPDWRAMFAKYVDVVGWNEGAYFLYEVDWTPEEWAEIQQIVAEKHARARRELSSDDC